MSRLLLVLGAWLLAACAQGQPTAPGQPNQPHLPPPGFPVSQTPVGKSCGGMVRSDGPECGEGEYCHRTVEAQCGAADAPGVCRPKPDVCTSDYTPVCGCDDNTYSNECAANAQGISAAYLGECAS